MSDRDLLDEQAAEIGRLQMELRANRQDTGAVIAGLQGEIKRLRAALQLLAEDDDVCAATHAVARRALEQKAPPTEWERIHNEWLKKATDANS